MVIHCIHIKEAVLDLKPVKPSQKGKKNPVFLTAKYLTGHWMIKGPFRILKWQDRNEFKFPNICICDKQECEKQCQMLEVLPLAQWSLSHFTDRSQFRIVQPFYKCWTKLSWEIGASPTQHKALEHFISAQDNQQQLKKKVKCWRDSVPAVNSHWGSVVS